MKGYPDLGRKIKCIVIATDAGSSRAESFKAVKAQIEKAEVFQVPDHELEFKDAFNGSPAIVVILVPIGKLGGLETLCIKAFSETNEGRRLAECQDRYFECSPAKPNEWGAEARDKGAFQCLIAASCKANPSMPTALAFSKIKGKEPPIIDIRAAAFNEIVDAMKTIVARVNGSQDMPKPACESPDDHYTPEETARRFEAALRGARLASPQPMKEIPPKRARAMRAKTPAPAKPKSP